MTRRQHDEGADMLAPPLDAPVTEPTPMPVNMAPHMPPIVGPFLTHHRTLGFRGRCGCGWEGEWRYYNVSAAEADIAAHRCEP